MFITLSLYKPEVLLYHTMMTTDTEEDAALLIPGNPSIPHEVLLPAALLLADIRAADFLLLHVIEHN